MMALYIPRLPNNGLLRGLGNLVLKKNVGEVALICAVPMVMMAPGLIPAPVSQESWRVAVIQPI